LAGAAERAVAQIAMREEVRAAAVRRRNEARGEGTIMLLLGLKPLTGLFQFAKLSLHYTELESGWTTGINRFNGLGVAMKGAGLDPA
jgi:hypothetical protein